MINCLRLYLSINMFLPSLEEPFCRAPSSELTGTRTRPTSWACEATVLVREEPGRDTVAPQVPSPPQWRKRTEAAGAVSPVGAA